jgi:putative transposase
VNLRDRGFDLLVRRIDLLRDAVRRVRARAPFRIDTWVVLPDHIHCLWILPPGDSDFPADGAQSRSPFKNLTCRRAAIAGYGSPRRTRHWQRRYWEHTIRYDCDFATHI